MSLTRLRPCVPAVSATLALLFAMLLLPQEARSAPQGEGRGIPLPFSESIRDGSKPSTAGTVFPFSSGPVLQPIQQLSYTEPPPAAPPPSVSEVVTADPKSITYAVTEPSQYFEAPVYQPIYKQQEDLPQRWLSAEALLWWTSSVDLPVLLTGSPVGTPGSVAGVPGQPTTNVLEGGGDIFGFAQGGVRLRAGRWFDGNDGNGFTAEFLMLASRGEDSFSMSNGEPILARPFFNAGPGNNFQDSQLIAFPGLSNGSFHLNAETRMYSVGLHYWEELYDSCCCGCCHSCGNGCGESRSHSCGDGCGRQCGHRCCSSRNNNGSFFQTRGRDDETSFGVFLGPRFAHLDDNLYTRESLTSVASQNRFDLQDVFQTENSFLGGEIGLRTRRRRGRMNFDLGLQLAIGATHQELDIFGSNTVTPANGLPATTAGGFLAQSSNIGSYDRTRFSLIPALDLKLGYQAASGWRFSVGYSLMYWTSVLRAGEQIDTTINEDFFAPPILPTTGANRPAPMFSESDYLAHGLTFGIEKSW